MAYQFSRNKTATFRFHPYAGTSTEYLNLTGVNASVTSADTICNGVSSLMAIGGNNPVYDGAVRTSKETVTDDDIIGG